VTCQHGGIFVKSYDTKSNGTAVIPPSANAIVLTLLVGFFLQRKHSIHLEMLTGYTGYRDIFAG
jgi:hypothetical protein